MRKTCTISIPTWYPADYAEQLAVLAKRLGFTSRSEFLVALADRAVQATGLYALGFSRGVEAGMELRAARDERQMELHRLTNEYAEAGADVLSAMKRAAQEETGAKGIGVQRRILSEQFRTDEDVLADEDS